MAAVLPDPVEMKEDIIASAATSISAQEPSEPSPEEPAMSSKPVAVSPAVDLKELAFQQRQVQILLLSNPWSSLDHNFCFRENSCVEKRKKWR